MVTIAGVQFQKNGSVFYFEAKKSIIKVGDYVIADTGHGLDLGEVIVGCREVEDDKTPSQIKKIVRIATPQDIQQSLENREKEKEAYTICQKKIGEHKLEMKLVSVEYSFDGSKIIFYFTANGRIDFRSLVKDLASVFKTRIELRQIGVRDEARMLGGLGQCGRPICCGAFLESFQPVSIKMAKEQGLSLNPTKISGVCGRLMCCLKYEQEQYEQIRKKMPKVGKEIRTSEGSGIVADLDILKEKISVRIQKGDSFETKTFTLEEINKIKEEESNLPESILEKEENEQELQDKRHPTVQQGKKKKNNNVDFSSGNQNFSGHIDKKTNDKQITNRKLGQPVKRENTKKTILQPTKEKEIEANSEHSIIDSGNKANNSWAKDLEKAMQAIDNI